MGARTQAREAALAMLYQRDLSGDGAEQVITAFLEGGLSEETLDPQARRFAEHLVRGVVRRLEELDGLIRAGSTNWRLERMAAVDRNVLRIALFELLDEPDTPAAVILDEAIELAKLFGGEESGAFVNGLADGIRRRLESGELVRG
jgi:N utilization substance protein B